MIPALDLTFVIPIRLDSQERKENLMTCISFLSLFFKSNILIIEADYKPSVDAKYFLTKNIKYIFVEDKEKVFHRTKYINIAVQNLKTDYIDIWDADVFVSPIQILLSLKSLRDKICEFAYPYDGRFLDIPSNLRREFIKTLDIRLLENNIHLSTPLYGPYACGGGFFANSEEYILCGMENENFIGWGQEDGERVCRWHKLNKRVIRLNGPLFHLNHPRGTNSKFLSENHRIKQINEYYRIETMSKIRLKQEISLWLKKYSTL